MSDELKKQAAEAAIEEIGEGMILGIGTGSTAEHFVRALAQRVRDGLLITGIATSERTEDLCRELEIPMSNLSEYPEIDVTVDGADELDGDLTLIKGGGGALLREKIVAAASRKMVVIADGSKLVGRLGAYPLPIEVNAFGIEPTRLAVAKICRDHGMFREVTLRTADEDDGLGEPYVTDGGHYILDAAMGEISEAAALARALKAVPGVVETGLFVALADVALVASADGVRRIERQG